MAPIGTDGMEKEKQGNRRRIVITNITIFLKVVISGKYKNLNKITKNLTHLPEISQTYYFCYSPQFTMQNRGTCYLKKCFHTERSKGNFVRENLKK